MLTGSKLVECKNDIRDSIEQRGIEVTGGMSTYADLIYQIRGNIYTLDFSALNYNEVDKINAYKCVNKIIKTSIDDASYNQLIFPTKDFCESERVPFETKVAVVAVPIFTPYNNIGWYNTGMFAGQHIITHIPRIDTINVSVMTYAFYNCFNLKYVELLDCSSCTDASSMFENAGTMSGEIYFEGFYNLGMQEEMSCWRMLDTSAYISRQSILNIFNNLYDRASAGYSIIKFTLSLSQYYTMSGEDLAIATNKGWTIEVI